MRLRHKALATFGLTAALLAGVLTAAVGGQDKVTICHAAGQDDTTHFVELTLAYPAVYGQAGHFYENGTTRAGHEQDTIGSCPTSTTTTSSSTTSTTTTTKPVPPTTSSTSTTTTVSTTTTEPVTTTTVPVTTTSSSTTTTPSTTVTSTTLTTSTTTTVSPTTTTTEPAKNSP